MFKSLLFINLFWITAFSANAEESFFVRCSSPKLDLTFEINKQFRTVRNIDHKNDMDVSYWSETDIEASFSDPILSLSRVVTGTLTQEFIDGSEVPTTIHVRLDRLKGSVRVIGANFRPESEKEECRKKYKNSFFI